MNNATKANTNSNIQVKDEEEEKEKKRTTVILGDSILKDIEPHKIRQGLGYKERIYIKSFSGANVEDMKSYVIPTKKYENDLIILHCVTNDLRENTSAENIVTSTNWTNLLQTMIIFY